MNQPKYALRYKKGNVLLTISIQGHYQYHTLTTTRKYPTWIVDYPEHAEMIRSRDDLPTGTSNNIPIHEFSSDELEVVEITDYKISTSNEIVIEKITPIKVSLPTYSDFYEYAVINHPDYARAISANGNARQMSFSQVMEMVKKKHSVKLKMKTAFDPYQNESKIILKF